MKKTLLIGTLFFALVSINAQISLQYEVHALKADTENDMALTSYTKPGASGENITWDFSKLTVKKDFLGTLANANNTKSTNSFPEANTQLNEFNNLFYFDVNENRVLEYGVTNLQKTYKIKYNSPCVKMVFPFEYGQTESGNYNGEYISGNITREINGEYLVTADAYGTLILPDVTVENTLRVKSIKEYTRKYNNTLTNIKVETYRWYNAFERFPLLVLIEVTTNINGNISTSHQAAYRKTVNLGVASGLTNTLQDAGLSIYPNPVSDEFTVAFQAVENETYTISVYDISGKLIGELFNGDASTGMNKLTFNANDYNLQLGSYLVKIKSANYFGQELIVIK